MQENLKSKHQLLQTLSIFLIMYASIKNDAKCLNLSKNIKFWLGILHFFYSCISIKVITPEISKKFAKHFQVSQLCYKMLNLR